MANKSIDELLYQEIKEIENNFSVHIKTKKINSASLTGLETMFIVLTFTLSGIVGGILSNIGKDLWTAIKLLIQKLRKKVKGSDSQTILFEVIYETSNIKIHLQRYIPANVDNDKYIDDFSQKVLEQSKAILHMISAKNAIPRKYIVYYLTDKGDWVEQM